LSNQIQTFERQLSDFGNVRKWLPIPVIQSLEKAPWNHVVGVQVAPGESEIKQLSYAPLLQF
jgi:hypothetical protein